MESVLSRIQAPELESGEGRGQLQLVSSLQNCSQSWDGVSRNSYPTARVRVSRGMELAATRIQPLELESAAG